MPIENVPVDVDEVNRCPKCRAVGETAVRQHVVDGHVVLDVGWRCPQCGHSWGFEMDDPWLSPN